MTIMIISFVVTVAQGNGAGFKLVSNFSDIIVQAKEKSEPSIITRYLIKVAQEYSSFYNKNKVICEESNVQTARLYLTYMVEQVLTAGLNLLGIKVPDHM